MLLSVIFFALVFDFVGAEGGGSVAMLMNSYEGFNYDHNFPWCDWYVYNLTKTL
jgi:hypothetical protein